MRTLVPVAVLALLVSPLNPAVAGIIDTPLPAGTSYLYTVPGVINGGGLGTYFSCTSTSIDPQNVTIEVFNNNGSAAGSATLVVAAGNTALFGTTNALQFAEDSLLGSPVVDKGVARIVSTVNRKLVCSAFVADVSNAPPTSTFSLYMIAKTKQKAAN